MEAGRVEVLRALVHRSARLLDDGAHDAWLALLAPDCAYRVETPAPETDGTNVWMALDRAELAGLFAEAPDHVWNIGQRSRLVAVDLIAPHAEGAATSATLAIFRTDEEGRSALQAVGRYDDVWRADGASFVLARRTVRLATRLLPQPSPLPF